LSSTEQMEILEDSCQATSTVSDHKKQEEMDCHQHIEILLLCGVALLLCGVTLLLCGVALLLCGVALLLCGVALLLCGLSPSLSSSSDLAETCGGSLLQDLDDLLRELSAHYDSERISRDVVCRCGLGCGWLYGWVAVWSEQRAGQAVTDDALNKSQTVASLLFSSPRQIVEAFLSLRDGELSLVTLEDMKIFDSSFFSTETTSEGKKLGR
jgi:hypothetical protein